MKLVVITTVIGPGFRLMDPTIIEPGVRYVCFTDREDVKSDRWEVVRVTSEGDPRVQCRQIKAMPWLLFPKVDASLWLDSRFLLHTRPRPFAEHWLEGWDFCALRHPDRDTIEEEAVVCAQLGKQPREMSDAQIRDYRGAGWTHQHAITSTGMCLRRHSKPVQTHGKLWWAEIAKGYVRDQMSCDFCAWQAGVRIGYFVGHYRDNPYAQWQK